MKEGVGLDVLHAQGRIVVCTDDERRLEWLGLGCIRLTTGIQSNHHMHEEENGQVYE